MLKTFPGPAYLHSEDEIVWLWHLLVNLDIHSSPFYFATTQSQYLMVNGRDGGLNTVSYLQVCLSVEGAKNVSWPWLSPFRGWDSLWHFQVNLDIYIYSSPFYLAMAQSHYLMKIGRDGGLSTLHHGCTFHDPGYLSSKDEIVWLYIHTHTYINQLMQPVNQKKIATAIPIKNVPQTASLPVLY